MSHGEFWFNPKCSKCRAAQELLDDEDTGYVVRRYLDTPPTAGEIDEVLDRLQLEHPQLIQRPIILTADGSAWIARTPEAVQAAITAERGAAADATMEP